MFGTAMCQGLALDSFMDIGFMGRIEPEKGLRFNPAKLLIDPYAKALTRQRGLESSGLRIQVRRPG